MLAELDLSKVHAHKVALREVDKNTESFKELCESIKKAGVINPVAVIEDKDNPGQYFVIDGRHRYTACKEIGAKSIPAKVYPPDTDEATLMAMQLIANIHKIETKAAQYTEHLKRIMFLQPSLTKEQIAEMLGKSPSWVDNRLSLEKIEPNVFKMVDNGTIGLANAYTLARLPEDTQKELAEQAAALPPAQFTALANAKSKELKAAARGQKAPGGAVEFVPPVHLRTRIVIEEEIANKAVASILCRNLSSIEEGFVMGLKWALHIDPISAEEARKKDVERKEASKAKAAAAAAEREAKKAALAAEAAKAAGL